MSVNYSSENKLYNILCFVVSLLDIIFTCTKASSVPNSNTMLLYTVQMSLCAISLIRIYTIMLRQCRILFAQFFNVAVTLHFCQYRCRRNRRVFVVATASGLLPPAPFHHVENAALCVPRLCERIDDEPVKAGIFSRR